VSRSKNCFSLKKTEENAVFEKATATGAIADKKMRVKQNQALDAKTRKKIMKIERKQKLGGELSRGRKL